MTELFNIAVNYFDTKKSARCNRVLVVVAGTSFMAFHFMLDSLSHMNDKDKQQVCNDISISVQECWL